MTDTIMIRRPRFCPHTDADQREQLTETRSCARCYFEACAEISEETKR